MQRKASGASGCALPLFVIAEYLRREMLPLQSDASKLTKRGGWLNTAGVLQRLIPSNFVAAVKRRLDVIDSSMLRDLEPSLKEQPLVLLGDFTPKDGLKETRAPWRQPLVHLHGRSTLTTS